MSQDEIAYQNKDITSKLLAEYFKGKTFKVYGLDLPEIKQVLPTNIPTVKANELRLDNLFELADGSIAIVDYESEYKKEDKIKYLNYLTGIANLYLKEKSDCPKLRMIVIYTGDIKRGQVSAQYDIGAVKVSLEPAFLSELDSDGIFLRLKEKVERNELLEDEELMRLIILPLSYRKKEEKETHIRNSVRLATQIQGRRFAACVCMNDDEKEHNGRLIADDVDHREAFLSIYYRAARCYNKVLMSGTVIAAHAGRHPHK